MKFWSPLRNDELHIFVIIRLQAFVHGKKN